MTRRAVEEGFDSHNRADDAAMAIQTPGKSMADQDTGRTFPAPSQSVPRMVAVVLLTAAAVLGGLYLLWQAREIVGWCVGGCVIAAALNPAVQRLSSTMSSGAWRFCWSILRSYSAGLVSWP